MAQNVAPPFDDYLTVSQAAKFLGISPWTLRNWDNSGKLKPIRHPMSGYRIYRQEELEAMLHSEGPTRKPKPPFVPAINWEDFTDREHFVQFYEDDEFLVESVANYVADGVAAGDGAIVIATHDHRERIAAKLAVRDIDESAIRATGQYLALDAAETLEQFMVGDAPDPARFEEVIGGAMAEMGDAFPHICAFGEMVALLWAEGKRDAACRLEALWNDLAKRHHFALFCAYPLSAFAKDQPGGSLLDVCTCHSRVIPAESFSAIPSPIEQFRTIAVLQHKAQRLETEIAKRRKSERELADFLENGVEGLHKVGADGTILWANRAELDMLGYLPEEYIGRPVADFHVDKDVIAEMLNALLVGQSLLNHRARLRCKDGSIKHVLIHSNGHFENGEFLYSRCFTRDVTANRQAERDRAMLAAIIDSSQDAIISKTIDGVIQSWNAAAERLFGYTEREVIGQPITILIPPERIEEEAEIMKCLRRGERVEHFETVRIRKDGAPVDISLTISPIHDRAGNVIGASKVARDITERTQAESAIRSLKDELAADLSNMHRLHEISTRLVRQDDIRELLGDVLDAAIEITRADLGNIQLLDKTGGVLKIVTQRGFQQDFLDFFDSVHDGNAACGTAMQARRRIVVEDVANDPIFKGTPAGEVMLKAGALAVQSTPLVSQSGELLGMFSTHYRSPHRPEEHDLQRLDLLARQAADLIERKQAEDALRESEQRFARFMQHLPGLAWIKDTQGRYSYINDAAEKAFDVSKAELYGKTDDEVFPADTAAQFKANDQKAAASVAGVQTVETLEHDDGLIHHSLVNKFPIPGPNGEVALLGGMAIDITAQYRAQEALRESEQRLAAELAATQALQRISTQMLHGGDIETLYQRIMDTATAIMGTEVASMQMLLPDQDARGGRGELRLLAARGFSPDAEKQWQWVNANTKSSCGMALSTGQRAIIPDMRSCEVMAGTKEQAAFLEAGILASQSTPLKSREGEMLGMISTHWVRPYQPGESELRLFDVLARQAADLIERMKAEEELRESEFRYRMLFESMDEGYCVAEVLFDDENRPVDYRFLDVNPAFEKQTGLKEAKGKLMRDLAPDHEQHWFDIYGRVATTGETLRFENHAAALNRWFDVCTFRIGPAELRRVGIVFNDITDRKKNQDAMKEADRRKDEFLATLAHELRNPLAPIRNSLHILRMTGGTEPAVKRVTEMMERQVSHMVRLVDDLLELSRISRGKIELKKERVALGTIISHAIETSRPMIEAGNHRIELQLSEEPMLLDGDHIRLSQVFANLINNAAKYTNPGGTITIAAAREGHELAVSISDTGIGIPRDMLTRVFDMFTQVDNPLRSSKDGLGIGLSLVRTLVLMHGGQVQAHSDGLGRGSEFTIRLPAATDGDAQAKTPSEEDIATLAAIRIVVVDDNRDAADSLAMLLKLIGADVHLAYDGASALEALSICRPAIALLDIGMPGMDGVEVAKRIRQDTRFRDITLIALTGWGQDDDRRRTKEAGFDHHLVKPVDFGALQALLSSLEERARGRGLHATVR